MTELSAVAGVMRVSARTQASNQLSSPAAQELGVVQPAAFLLLTVWASRHPSAREVVRLAIGAGLMSLWSSTIWASGGILRQEIRMGTLPSVISSPFDTRLLLIAKSLAATVLSTTLIAATCLVSVLALGYAPTVARPWWFVEALVLAIASATALGLLLSCVFALTRAAIRVSEALMYPVFIVGGLLVPLRLLPVWLRWPSWFISQRWVQSMMSAAVDGRTLGVLAPVPVLLLTIGYALLGALLLRRVLDRGRRRGTLEFR